MNFAPHLLAIIKLPILIGRYLILVMSMIMFTRWIGCSKRNFWLIRRFGCIKRSCNYFIKLSNARLLYGFNPPSVCLEVFSFLLSFFCRLSRPFFKANPEPFVTCIGVSNSFSYSVTPFTPNRSTKTDGTV